MSDYIPSELISKILARLPIGDVLRCTSVCKSWYNLITSSFISSHLNSSISNTQTRLLFRFTTRLESTPRYCLHRDNQTFDEIQEFKFPRIFFEGEHYIYGSSNGIFCCSDDKIIILWNPSLKKSLLFSPIKELPPGTKYNFGFDFLPGTNNYKIVKVLQSRFQNSDGLLFTPEVEIYDSCTSSWHNVDAGEISYVLDVGDNYPANLKGIVHWNARNPHDERTFINLIASFDLENEKFGALMLPKSLQTEEYHFFSLSTLKDSLCLLHTEGEDESDVSCSIYIMKEYGVAESWEKLFNIENSLEPFYFRENGEFLFKDHNGMYDLVSYDPKASKVTDLGVHKGARHFSAYPYVDSLFLIQDWNIRY